MKNEEKTQTIIRKNGVYSKKSIQRRRGFHRTITRTIVDVKNKRKQKRDRQTVKKRVRERDRQKKKSEIVKEKWTVAQDEIKECMIYVLHTCEKKRQL